MIRSDQPANDEAAALWFAKRRRGVMTLEERAALDTWRSDPANAAALAQLQRDWELLEDAEIHVARTPAPVARHRIARSALLAVMCAVFIGIGVISYSGNHEFWTTLDWIER